MSLISYGAAPAKGSTTTVYLDKQVIADLSADAWWQDWQNISQASITLKSSTGRSRITLTFDVSADPCSAQMTIPLNTRDQFEVHKAVFIDSLGDKLSLDRAALVAAIPSLAVSDFSLAGDVTGPEIVQALAVSDITFDSMNLSVVASDPSEPIDYKWVYSESNNISTIADAEANGIVIADWATNNDLSSFTAPSYGTGATYYFAVLVRDGLGNKSISTISAATLSDQPPVIDVFTTGITGNPPAIEVSELTVLLQATDDFDGQLNASFFETASLASSIAEAESGTFLVTHLIDSGVPLYTTPGLAYMAEGSRYFAAVVEESSSGRKVFATSTLNVNYPPFIEVPSLTLSGANQSGLNLSFYHATDSTPVEYKIVRSTANNISSVADAEANGTVVSNWDSLLFYSSEMGTINYPVTGLSSGTTYYFNVIARDQAGAKSAYTSASASTMGEADPFVSLSVAPTAGATIEQSVFGTTVTTYAGESFSPTVITLQLNQSLQTQLSSANVWSLWNDGPESFSDSSHVFIVDDTPETGGEIAQLYALPDVGNIQWDSVNLRYTLSLNISTWVNTGINPNNLMYAKTGQIKVRRDRLCSALGCGTGSASIYTVPGLHDSDSDGLPNPFEAAYGTNPNNPDTDGGGVSDGDEVTVYGTNPNDPGDDPV